MSVDRFKDGPADADAWTLPPSGDALTLVSSGIADAARQLGVEPCAAQAVIQVESSGSGFEKSRPKLRYENHDDTKMAQHYADCIGSGG